MDALFKPITGGFSNKSFLYLRRAIGELKLKNVSAGFYIEANRQRIFKFRGNLVGQNIEILGI